VLNVHFVILGAGIAICGQAAYVRETILGRTQPNRVSWLLWAIAPLLSFVVEIQAGVGLRSLMTLVAGLGPVAIFTASFVNRSSVWRLSR